MSNKDVDSEDINRDKYNTDPRLDDIVDYSFREEGLPVVRVLQSSMGPVDFCI